MGGFKDIPAGTTFGKLTVINRAPGKSWQTFFRCKCACGNELDVNSVQLRNGKKTSCGCDRRKPVPGVRSGSHSSRSPHMRPSSFMSGRPGLRESRNINFSTPAYGSVQVSEGRFYWVAFKHLSDWRDGGEPWDSGFHTNEMKAHSAAREAVRHLLLEREALHRRILEELIRAEQVARYMVLLERGEDGTIAGYEWEDVCREQDYDAIDFYAESEESDSLQALDEETAGRSASTRSTPLPAVREGGRYGHGVPTSSVGKVSDDQAA
jgi:hypothetical protein